MNMIEKVASAIAKQAGDDDRSDWDGHMGFARVAIQALRVPTDTMAKAGEDEAIACSSAECCSQAYTAMIDAALKEQ